MQEQLCQKLVQKQPYTNTELIWCLDHIGHPNPDIRDGLIYSTFCHAFEQECIHTEQYHLLCQEILERQLLVSSDSLTRSFAALLAALLLFYDNQPEGAYYGQMTDSSKARFFSLAKTYLENEKDNRGYDVDLGWIHAIAHGSDYLMSVSSHKDFPEEQLKDLWDSALKLLKNQETVFSAGEADRLANIFISSILAQKLLQEQLVDWVEQLDIPDSSPTDYFRSLNTKQVLTSIYMTLEKEGLLENKLKQAILAKW